MSQAHDSAPLDYYGVQTPQSSPLVRLGGALGIAASIVGLLILLAGCAGLNKAVVFSIIPVVLAAPGLVLTLVGAISQKNMVSEDTHVLLAVFTNACGLIGGLVEMAVWRGWPIFS